VDREDIAVLYREYGGMLCALMRIRFRIPESEAEGLLHDIFASLLRSSARIEHPVKWLVAAACNASRLYWRNAGPRMLRVTDRLPSPHNNEESVLLADLLERLPVRTADVILLRYIEGLSGKEIAQRYGLSVGYTHLLVYRGMKRARALAEKRR
jgi:RNA polymerase sigma-70 factor, ECF subfamily